MIEVETNTMVGIVIALLAYIAGRTEIFGKCLRELKTDFQVHVGIFKDHNKVAANSAAI